MQIAQQIDHNVYSVEPDHKHGANYTLPIEVRRIITPDPLTNVSLVWADLHFSLEPTRALSNTRDYSAPVQGRVSYTEDVINISASDPAD